jgi:epoxyqueuosine reductase
MSLAHEAGFQRTVIASLEPMTASLERYQGWIDNGFAADMNYLKRDPSARNSPAQVLPGARSAIMISVSYYTEKPPVPGLYFGDVARYAVGLDYHAVLRKKLRDLSSAIEKAIGKPLVGKAFTDHVQLHERALAARHGLGFAGKNTLIIGPKLSGSYHFIAELFTDLDIAPDEAYQGTCGECFRCGKICPTNAIVKGGQIDSNLCISYLTIENKGGIPVSMRNSLGTWVFGCDVCQEVCPYNQRPNQTPWVEFLPESGNGHHLDLLAMLELKTDQEFLKRFEPTPLRRPKRRGILRNSLVVLGNILKKIDEGETKLPECEMSAEQLCERLFELASEEPDAMLREHAAWALSQSRTALNRQRVENIAALAIEADQKQLILQHLENL